MEKKTPTEVSCFSLERRSCPDSRLLARSARIVEQKRKKNKRRTRERQKTLLPHAPLPSAETRDEGEQRDGRRHLDKNACWFAVKNPFSDALPPTTTS